MSLSRATAASTAPESCSECSWNQTSKSVPNSCSARLISSNISSTPTRRNTSVALGVGQRQRVRLGRDDLRGDLADVVAAVAVLRGRLALRPRRPASSTNRSICAAGVVEVVLPGDLGPARGQHPAQRVADRGPPGAAQVQRAGRVGRDELQVDVAAGVVVAGAVAPRPRPAPRRRCAPCASAASRRLMKPGPGDLGRRDAGAGRPAPRPASRPAPAAARRPSSRCAGPRWWRSRRARGCAAARRPTSAGSAAEVQAASRQHVGRRRHGRVRRAGRGSPLESRRSAHRASQVPLLHSGRRSSRGTRASSGRFMVSGKNSKAVRNARAAVVTRRSVPWGLIAAITVVVLFAGFIFGYAYLRNQENEAQAAALAPFTPTAREAGPVDRHPGRAGGAYEGGQHIDADRRRWPTRTARRWAAPTTTPGRPATAWSTRTRCAARTSCTRWSTARCGSPTTRTRSPGTR